MDLEVLVATVDQKDFSLIQKMNIQSDVVIANQTDNFSFKEIKSDKGYSYKMVSTNTKGVGINRNVALLYSSKDICLFADDDIVYSDDYTNVILHEFEIYPNADIIIFNVGLKGECLNRIPKITKNTYKMHKWNKNGFATFRIAFRRNSFLKNNLFFSIIYGGGCKYPFGEDTLWIEAARRNNLNIYVSNKFIGEVDQSNSSWFNKIDPRKYFYGRGAYLKNLHPFSYLIWIFLYYSRKGSLVEFDFKKRIRWMLNGARGFKKLISFEEFIKTDEK